MKGIVEVSVIINSFSVCLSVCLCLPGSSSSSSPNLPPQNFIPPLSHLKVVSPPLFWHLSGPRPSLVLGLILLLSGYVMYISRSMAPTPQDKDFRPPPPIYYLPSIYAVDGDT